MPAYALRSRSQSLTPLMKLAIISATTALLFAGCVIPPNNTKPWTQKAKEAAREEKALKKLEDRAFRVLDHVVNLLLPLPEQPVTAK